MNLYQSGIQDYPLPYLVDGLGDFTLNDAPALCRIITLLHHFIQGVLKLLVWNEVEDLLPSLRGSQHFLILQYHLIKELLGNSLSSPGGWV